MIFSLSDTPHARLLPSQEEMRRFDQQTNETGTPSQELMERAGVEVFRELKERFSFELYSNGRVVVLAGPGNNGGDGLVIARHLKDHGYEVLVVLASHARYSSELLEQIELFRRSDGAIRQFPESATVGEQPLEVLSEAELQVVLKGSSVIVDALLGTGQKAAPVGAVGAILEQVTLLRRNNPEPPRFVAVDLPTGVNGDTGEVYSGAIHADLTVAIELIKRGMLQYPARSVCGDIWVVKIGLRCDQAQFSLLDRTVARQLLPRRPESHKGNFGTVMVIGGCEDMPGAPFLAASAALQCGAGLVFKAHLRATAMVGMMPEIMLVNVGEQERSFCAQHIEVLRMNMEGAQALVLGPGLGTAPETVDFVQQVIEFSRDHKIPLVIDADALNCLTLIRMRDKDFICPGAVLTPHPGEMARLLGISPGEVQRDRYRACSKLAKLIEATVVLKGAATVICSADSGWVNTSGNACLAVPGSGDVLCGLIGFYLAQGFSLAEAACAGVLLHGRAGDLLEQEGETPFVARAISRAAARLVGEELRIS